MPSELPREASELMALIDELHGVKDHPSQDPETESGSSAIGKHATGKIAVLSSGDFGCYIKLANLLPPPGPKDGFFLLKPEHPNFNAIYSLVLSSAENGSTLSIITIDVIDPALIATVTCVYQTY